MYELIFIAVFIAWYLLSLYLSEIAVKKSHHNTEWLFFVCMIFSPLVGLVVLKLLKPKKSAV